jgi:integrase
MPVHKRTNPSGKVVWSYMFNAAGSTRKDRRQISKSGFKTKEDATKAEAARRMEEQDRAALVKAGAVTVGDALPKTLGELLQEFIRQHADPKLSPVTAESYRERAAYISPELAAMPLEDITPLRLNREWDRILKAGGRTKKEKTPRPVSAKTVQCVAGLVSSAFGRAIRWGLVKTNPVTYSEPPAVKKHQGAALTPAQQALVFGACRSWWLRPFLELAAATGCRRGELLALRWSDIVDGRATIARSVVYTKAQGIFFKGTKTDKPRTIKVPASALAVLEAHRRKQSAIRALYEGDYRAGDLIFAATDGAPINPDTVSGEIYKMFRRLKLPTGISLHSLRHTHTSELLADGVPLTVVSARLGHTSIRTTQEIYAHMIHGQDDDAADRWEEYHNRNKQAPTGTEKGQVQ